jgi:DNA end-binding protein Ku
MNSLGMMRFAHEIVDSSELNLPAKVEVTEKEMALANMLIDSMSGAFEPAKYRDEYHDKVLKVIKAKVEGVTLKLPAPAAKAPGKVVDLMEVLKESLKETQKKGASAKEPKEEVLVADSGRSPKPKIRKAR